jgi:hypothetical protein
LMGSRPFPTETRMLSDFQHSGASVLSSMVDQVAQGVHLNVKQSCLSVT